MCINKECQSDSPKSIEDHRFGDQTMQAAGILQIHELDRFEKSFGAHPEIAEEAENRLIDVLFRLRQLCWDCARPEIEKEMSWKFSWLDFGISLEKHEDVSEFLNYYQPLDDAWNDLLVINHDLKLFGFSDDDDTVHDKLVSFKEQGVTPENVVEIAEWFRLQFREPIQIDELGMHFDAGYRSETDMKMLYDNDLFQDLSFNCIPSKALLLNVGIDGATFKNYEDVLYRLTEYRFMAEAPQEVQVERLLLSGIEIDRLREIDEEIGFNPLMSEVMDELDDEAKNAKGESIFDIFTKTVSALSKVCLELTTENIAKYWGLSDELILHIVDNGLLSDEVLRIARLVEEPTQLNGWLAFNENTIEAGEIREWVKAGFDAQDAVRWKVAEFDAESAAKWRMVVDNPTVARRRLDAGIQLPESATEI
jgi:hypothetical protein